MIRVYNFHVVVRCDYMTSHHTITSTSPRYAAQTSALRHFYNRLKTTKKHSVDKYTIRVRFTKNKKHTVHEYTYIRQSGSIQLT
jgi:hypothetical protein